MWRYLAGAVAALLLAGAGLFLFGTRATERVALPAPPEAVAGNAAFAAAEPEPLRVPEATPKTREEKRFDRYDKDRDDSITREEYLASRRKAFAKLDTDGDGRLSFEEWAIRTTTRFADADADRSRTLDRAEFATTAPKRRAPRRPAECPPGTSDEG